MKVAYFDKKGKIKKEKFTLKDDVFNAEVNKILLTLSVNAYLANQRQSTANTKTRGEVRGGGKKPWKQKGTGRARVGSIRSPLWRGGGVTFGPKSTDNYRKELPKKMTKTAIKSSLSLKTQEGNVVVFQDIDLNQEAKTKGLVKILKEFLYEKTLLIQAKNNSALLLASRNIKNINVKGVNELNTYTILNTKKIIILEEALEQIYKFWGNDKKTKKITKSK